MYPTTDRRLLPYLFYENLARAIPWLTEVFGFEERFRLELPNGAIAHAEIALGEGVVMLGNVGPRNRSKPMSVRSSVYVFVDDVERHCSIAQSGGAEIVLPPADQPFGDRMYVALDCERHEWYFAQHLRDIAVDQLQQMVGGGGG